MAEPAAQAPSEMELLGEIEVPSEEGNELLAMSEVVQLVEQTDFPADRIQQLQTAVSEATMNAMEHGNRYRPDAPVILRVFHSPTRLLIQIIDESTEEVRQERVEPNLNAKLAGEQSPRGWGLLLIEHMVDEINSSYSSEGHMLELNFYLEGEHHAGE